MNYFFHQIIQMLDKIAKNDQIVSATFLTDIWNRIVFYFSCLRENCLLCLAETAAMNIQFLSS